MLGTCLTLPLIGYQETRSSKIAQVVYHVVTLTFCDNIIKKQEKTNMRQVTFSPASGNIYQHYLNELKLSQ